MCGGLSAVSPVFFSSSSVGALSPSPAFRCWPLLAPYRTLSLYFLLWSPTQENCPHSPSISLVLLSTLYPPLVWEKVRFDEVLRVLFIPSWRVLRPCVRESTWLSTQELSAAKKRSVVEFEFEEFEFEKVWTSKWRGGKESKKRELCPVALWF
jgi:hypothetical protein